MRELSLYITILFFVIIIMFLISGNDVVESYDYSLDYALEKEKMSEYQITHGFSMYPTIYSAMW